MINRPKDDLFEACNCLQRNKESITRHNSKVCFHFRCYGWEPHLDSVANPGVGAGPGALLIERLRPPNFFQAWSYLALINVRQPVERLIGSSCDGTVTVQPMASKYDKEAKLSPND